jgi:hypothetical protein
VTHEDAGTKATKASVGTTKAESDKPSARRHNVQSATNSELTLPQNAKGTLMFTPAAKETFNKGTLPSRKTNPRSLSTPTMCLSTHPKLKHSFDSWKAC